jgi:hypothetical protein
MDAITLLIFLWHQWLKKKDFKNWIDSAPWPPRQGLQSPAKNTVTASHPTFMF